jgi:hypothetical protein
MVATGVWNVTAGFLASLRLPVLSLLGEVGGYLTGELKTRVKNFPSPSSICIVIAHAMLTFVVILG